MKRTTTSITAAAGVSLVMLGGVTWASVAADATPTGGAESRVASAPPTHPSPAHFTHGRVDNAWFPLKPGNRLVYRGSDEGVATRDVFLVTYGTKVVDGVVCREVRDRVFRHGLVRERTRDWYAQTRRGVVWYFGESTATLDKHGHIQSREGSFRSGRDGAEAGIFMPAHPRVGDSFLQENYPGHAEDRFRILSMQAQAPSAVVDSRHAMLTRETTRLEPGVVDHKTYVRDIGTVTEQTVRGGSEKLHLVAITHVRRG